MSLPASTTCIKKYGSGKVKWADLVGPAIEYAEQGFVLDAALPTTIAEGRQYFEKHAAAQRIYPARRQGAEARAIDSSTRTMRRTLRAIATDGADAFYRGDDRATHRRDMR